MSPDLKNMHLPCTAVDLGLVEAVGVCNYKTAQLQQFHSLMDVRGIPVASNQVCCGGQLSCCSIKGS